jgi:BirA family biotin operon repressor/biotin-[acetyl-CoA-carboxylase] ligase
MKATWLGAQRIELPSCTSTNDEAGRLARAGASHGTIIIADTQSAGRGREGRAWASPPGAGLYLSIIVRPPLSIALVPPMTLAVGIGACDAARAVGVDAELKWPNDILAGGKKLAGVLVETQSQGSRLESVVIGIGMNLGGELPPELTTATTLARVKGAPVSRAELLEPLLAHVQHWLDRYVAAGLDTVIEAWHARMARDLPARATVDGAPLIGTCAGLDADGALLLRDAAGALHRVRTGDVALASYH